MNLFPAKHSVKQFVRRFLASQAENREIIQKNTRGTGAGQCAAFAPDGRWVAAGDSYAVRIWDLKNGREQQPLQDSEIQWWAAFTPDGTRLVSGGAGRLNVWDVKKHAKIGVLPTAGSYYVQTMAASPDNLHLAAIPVSPVRNYVFRGSSTWASVNSVSG